MLEHLSQPVAFATAPLAPPENGPSSSRIRTGNSDTDLEDTFTKTFNRGLDFVKAARSKMLVRNDSGTYTSDSDSGRPGITTFPPKPIADDWDDEFEADGTVPQSPSAPGILSMCAEETADDDMTDSFFVIPSKSDSSLSALKKENAVIKAQLEDERKKLAAAERLLKQRQEQDQHLRESIMLARKEVSAFIGAMSPKSPSLLLQAHRAMTSSIALRPPAALASPSTPAAATPVTPVDIAALAINVPPPPPPAAPAGPGRDRNEPQLVRRVRELEEEVRTLRAENEKQVCQANACTRQRDVLMCMCPAFQRTIIVKFRDRWEKLKESSRRKKEARAAAERTSVANVPIEEDPEAEAEAEKEDLKPRKHTEGPVLS